MTSVGRRVGWASAAVAVAGYGAVLAWFRLNEDRLIFQPLRAKLAPPPARLQLHSRDVPLRTADGIDLKARLIPPPAGVPPEQAGWILYFHGSSANIATAGYNEAWARFRDMGLGVLAVDYRGYGESGGRPSETGFYRDADAAYAYLTGALKVPPARIVIYGFSLGSAVAIDLATRARAAGMIVEGAFLSVSARGGELYPYLPAGWLVHNRFASAEKIARVSLPKLFVHARGDTDIPIAHGRRLYQLAVEPKRFQEVEGAHATAYKVDPSFFRGVARFIAELGIPLLQS